MGGSEADRAAKICVKKQKITSTFLNFKHERAVFGLVALEFQKR